MDANAATAVASASAAATEAPTQEPAAAAARRPERTVASGRDPGHTPAIIPHPEDICALNRMLWAMEEEQDEAVRGLQRQLNKARERQRCIANLRQTLVRIGHALERLRSGAGAVEWAKQPELRSWDDDQQVVRKVLRGRDVPPMG